MPVPFVTVQVCGGLVGCVDTVTLNVAPTDTGVAKVNVVAFAATCKLSPPLSCNTKLVYPPQDVLEKTFDKVKPRPNLPNRNGDLAWPALLRKLARVDTSYRN